MSLKTSAAVYKGERRGSGCCKGRPDPASKIGRAYDLLISGAVINLSEIYGNRGRANEVLMEYGLELVPYNNQGVKCAGIWDGDEIIPLERWLLDR